MKLGTTIPSKVNEPFLVTTTSCWLAHLTISSTIANSGTNDHLSQLGRLAALIATESQRFSTKKLTQTLRIAESEEGLEVEEGSDNAETSRCVTVVFEDDTSTRKEEQPEREEKTI